MKGPRNRFPVYSRLLKLYPKPYRERYQDEILLTAADMIDNSQRTTEKIITWSQLIFDLPLNVVKQNLQYIGGAMHNGTPHYLRRNSLISAVLLLPFFGSILANTLDRLINNRDLYNSWLWHTPALTLWVLYLPAAAFLLSLVTYSLFVVQGGNKTSWTKRTLDILHAWPIIIVGFIALGILTILEFHDSTQCIVRTPAHAVTHAMQTLHCIESNRAIIPRHDLSL